MRYGKREKKREKNERRRKGRGKVMKELEKKKDLSWAKNQEKREREIFGFGVIVHGVLNSTYFLCFSWILL